MAYNTYFVKVNRMEIDLEYSNSLADIVEY